MVISQSKMRTHSHIIILFQEHDAHRLHNSHIELQHRLSKLLSSPTITKLQPPNCRENLFESLITTCPQQIVTIAYEVGLIGTRTSLELSNQYRELGIPCTGQKGVTL